MGADHVAPAHELGPLLGELARLPAAAAGGVVAADAEAEALRELRREVAIAAVDEHTHTDSPRYGDPSRFSCPECGGVLWDVSSNQGGPLRFRCDTGHAYSPANLAEAQVGGVEAALWSSLRALENAAELARLRAENAQRRGLQAAAAHFVVQWEAVEQHATAVRELLRMDGRIGLPLPG